MRPKGEHYSIIILSSDSDINYLKTRLNGDEPNKALSRAGEGEATSGMEDNRDGWRLLNLEEIKR